MKVILEGCDLAGKSTAIELIDGMFPVQDRLMEFTKTILPDNPLTPATKYSLSKIVDANKEDLFVILIFSDDNSLARRLELRSNPDEYDIECLNYNLRYREAAEYLKDKSNVYIIDASFMSKFEKTAMVFKAFLEFKHPDVSPFTI